MEFESSSSAPLEARPLRDARGDATGDGGDAPVRSSEQGATAQTIAGGRYDVIVVGGGVGGLAAGAKLAREGLSVLLVEKHRSIGGYATSFGRRGYRFEAGLHELNEIGSPSSRAAAICRDLGLDGRLELERVPDAFAVHRGAECLEVPRSWAEAERLLGGRFPAEREAIVEFLGLERSIFLESASLPGDHREMVRQLPTLHLRCPRTMEHLRTTVRAALDRHFTDETLKILLSANVGYYHSRHDALPFIFFAGANGSYTELGGWFPKGGARSIADALAAEIAAAGGTLALETRAERILTAGTRVLGVELRDARRLAGPSTAAWADAVVMNAPMPLLPEMLQGPERAMARRSLGAFETGTSLFNVYLALERPLREIGNRCYSSFHFPESVRTLDDFEAANESADFAVKPLTLVDYSMLSGSDPHHPTASACALDHAPRWAGLPSGKYQKAKKEAVNVILNRLEAALPGFRENVAFVEAATPLTMERFTANPRGAVYGFAMSLDQMGPSRPQSRSILPRLYVASAWTAPGGGIVSALTAGHRAACQILADSR
jgi:phytoene dehydrogenase-like protein